MRTNSRRRDQGLALAVLTVVLSLPDVAWAQQSGFLVTRKTRSIKRTSISTSVIIPRAGARSRRVGAAPVPRWRARRSHSKRSRWVPDRLLVKGNRPTPTCSQRPVGQIRGRPCRLYPRVDAHHSSSTLPVIRPVRRPADGNPHRRDRRMPTNSPPLSGNDVPDLSAPIDQPRRSQGTRLAHREDEEQPAPGETGDAPLLALPDIAVPALDPSGSPTPANTASNSATTGGSPAPRRGLISGFFNNLGWNWTRR
jgi:hypothetical protein